MLTGASQGVGPISVLLKFNPARNLENNFRYILIVVTRKNIDESRFNIIIITVIGINQI